MGDSRTWSRFERAGQRNDVTHYPPDFSHPFRTLDPQAFASLLPVCVPFRQLGRRHPRRLAASFRLVASLRPVAIAFHPHRCSRLPVSHPASIPHAILTVRQRPLSSASPSSTTVGQRRTRPAPRTHEPLSHPPSHPVNSDPKSYDRGPGSNRAFQLTGTRPPLALRARRAPASS